MPKRPPLLRIDTMFSLKLALVILLILAWIMVDVYETKACSYIRMPPSILASDAFDKSQVVFSGTPIAKFTLYNNSVDIENLRQSGPGRNLVYLYEIKVDTVWKGPLYEYAYISLNPFEVCSNDSLALGVEHLVYAGHDASLTVGGGLRPLAAAQEDLAVLGRGVLPVAGMRAPYPQHLDGMITEEALLRHFGECLNRLDLTLYPSSTLPASTAASPPVPAPIEAPKISAFCDEAGTPNWLIPVVSGTAGGFAALLLGALGTIYTLRRRRGST